MKITKHIPNFITSMNLLCGCLALSCISHNDMERASWLVIIAAILDFLDGFLARILQAYSPLGKQLDSLADMVTFGVVPGYMLYQYLGNAEDIFILKNPWIVYIPFLVTIFSALRLAKFNIDERQTEGFIGLPTPACTLFIISFPLIEANDQRNLQFLIHPVLILVVSLILSFLLVSEIPMFSLKFKHFNFRTNEVRYLFLVIALVLLLILHFTAIPIIIVLYIMFSAGLDFLPEKYNNMAR